MIRKSGYRFSEKIILEQKDRARWRFDEKPSRSRRCDVTSRGAFALARTHWLCDNCRIHSADKKNCSALGTRRSIMTINVKSYANADDVLIAWQPDQWPADWIGFQLERRDETTKAVTVLVNRI